MADEITLAAADGASVVGRQLSLPAGEGLSLRLPPARRLDRAALTLRAADDGRTAPDGLVLTTDVGTFPLPAGQAARWVAASWAFPRAIVAVRLDAAGGEKAGARLKTLSGGVWLPLWPVDVVRLNAEQGFPAVGATQIMAELLVENVIDGKPTGVLVPGALAVTAVSVSATRQPCHVAVAIADDPPFFTHPGPLPTTAVAVEGLARAANRWLADHPEAAAVPLVLQAAGPASLVVDNFIASLRPLSPRPRAPDASAEVGDIGSTPARAERLLVAPTAAVQRGRGQWCSASHIAAQSFAALPEEFALSSLRMALRAVGGPCVGELLLCADVHGRPLDPARAAVRVPFTLQSLGDSPGAGDDEAEFPACHLPVPLRPATGRWWAVCRLTAGEAVWYTADGAPAEAGPTLRCGDGGPWLEAPAATGGGWAQTWVRVVVDVAASR